MDQVRDNFRVGVRGELVAERSEPGADRFVVLDDAVVHHRDAAGDVRVGVALGGHAVRGPARMADADGAVQGVLLGQLLELSHPPARAQALQRAIDDGHAGRVVAAVLEALEALDQDRHDVAAGYRSDDSAHRYVLRMKSAPATARAAAAPARRLTKAAAPMTAATTAQRAWPAVPRHRS